MNLLREPVVVTDDLTPAQRALLDGVAYLTDGHPGVWADQLAVHRWARAKRGLWVAGGGVNHSLERRGLIEVAMVQDPRGRRQRRGPWNRSGMVIRLTHEGLVEQFAGAEA